MKERKTEAYWVEKSQRWQIKVQDDGERKTFYSSSPGKKGKIEAEKKADRWILDRRCGDNVRFGRLWEGFIADVEKTKSRTRYLGHDSRGRNHILPLLEHRRVATLTRQDWQTVINTAAEKGLAYKTLCNLADTIKSVYKYAFLRNIQLPPTDFLEIPKNAPKGKRIILQPDGIRTLLTVGYITHYGRRVPCHYIYAWRFYLITGLRRGELCGLKKSYRQGDHLVAKNPVNYLGEVTEGKTKNAEREMVLTPQAQAILDDQEAMLKRRGIESEWIFPDEHGEMSNPNRVYRLWRTYRKQHGIPCSIHELRHTFFSVCKEVPPELIKLVGGHSEAMDTFGVYGHRVDGELERAAELISESFERVGA